MIIKKKCFSTQLSDLYGRDNYQSRIQVGRTYWWFCPENTKIYRKTLQHWNQLEVTYIRSGCMFYKWVDYTDLPEEFCPLNCFMSSTLILGEIDPDIDLDGKLTKIDQFKYYFDDTHTIVHNWPNERIIEIDENELYEQLVKLKSDDIESMAEYLYIKSLEIKDNEN